MKVHNIHNYSIQDSSCIYTYLNNRPRSVAKQEKTSGEKLRCIRLTTHDHMTRRVKHGVLTEL